MPPFHSFLHGHLTEQVFYKILHILLPLPTDVQVKITIISTSNPLCLSVIPRSLVLYHPSTFQQPLRQHYAIGIDYTAFAFFALNGNLLSLVQFFDHQGDYLSAPGIENERMLIDADGGGFDLSIIHCPVGTGDDIRIGMVRIEGNADHGDLAPMLL